LQEKRWEWTSGAISVFGERGKERNNVSRSPTMTCWPTRKFLREEAAGERGRIDAANSYLPEEEGRATGTDNFSQSRPSS